VRSDVLNAVVRPDQFLDRHANILQIRGSQGKPCGIHLSFANAPAGEAALFRRKASGQGCERSERRIPGGAAARNGPGLTGHGMDGSKLACERPARGPVQPMVRARLRGGSIGWTQSAPARSRRRASVAVNDSAEATAFSR
jgi:hypothetical protein